MFGPASTLTKKMCRQRTNGFGQPLGSDFSGGGRILDDAGQRPRSVQRKLVQSEVLTFRRLIVLRTAVDTHWPVVSPTAAHGVTGDLRSERTPSIPKPSARTNGRPSFKGLVWNTLSQMQNDRFQMSVPQKLLAAEIARRNSTQVGAKGWSERTLLTHISMWLAERTSPLARATEPRRGTFSSAKTDFHQFCQIEFLRMVPLQTQRIEFALRRARWIL